MFPGFYTQNSSPSLLPHRDNALRRNAPLQKIEAGVAAPFGLAASVRFRAERLLGKRQVTCYWRRASTPARTPQSRNQSLRPGETAVQPSYKIVHIAAKRHIAVRPW